MLVLYYALRAQSLWTRPARLAVLVVVPLVLLFLSVVAHELGHVFAARRFGLRAERVVLSPLGGIAIVAQGRTPSQELGVAIAGPLVNLTLAVGASLTYLSMGGPWATGLLLSFGNHGVFYDLLLGHRFFLLVQCDFTRAQMGLASAQWSRVQPK